MYSFYPRPKKFSQKRLPNSEKKITRILEEYFGQPVVLFSSGRTALGFYLNYRNFNLYKNTIAIPDFFPDCVLAAIVSHAFPVRGNKPFADALLYYNQYGYQQLNNKITDFAKDYKIIIEDSAHSFFDTRQKKYPRILSFAKFFPVNFGGALILTSQKEKKNILQWRDQQPILSIKKEREVQRFFYDCFAHYNDINPNIALQANISVASSIVQYYIHPLKTTLSNLPQNIQDLKKVAQTRMDYFEYLRDRIFQAQAKKYLSQVDTPPFIIPCYFSENRMILNKLIKQMHSIGINAKVYHIDIKRDQMKPLYTPAVILPCHQEIPWNKIKKMGKILEKYVN